MSKGAAITIVVSDGLQAHTHACYIKPGGSPKALADKGLFVAEIARPCTVHHHRLGTEYVRHLDKEGIYWIYGHFPEDSIEVRALLVAWALSE